MTSLEAQLAQIESATGVSADKLDTAAGRAKLVKAASKDPAVRKALQALAAKNADTSKNAADDSKGTRPMARVLDDSDKAAARTTNSLSANHGVPSRGATGSPAVQLAQMVPQQPMMQQMPVSSAPVMAQPASTGYPAGTVFLTGEQLKALAAGGIGSSGARTAPWNGKVGPDPISVNDVAYEKKHGKLSEAQLNAAIDGALDKNGITDQAARAKWKSVLKHMSFHESGHDASAVNLTDSNAIGPTQVDGAPAQSSRGAWQTIPQTFASNHVSGTSNNIYDPEASAAAAVRYMMNRYEISSDGTGLDEFYASRPAGAYVGY